LTKGHILPTYTIEAIAHIGGLAAQKISQVGT